MREILGLVQLFNGLPIYPRDANPCKKGHSPRQADTSQNVLGSNPCACKQFFEKYLLRVLVQSSCYGIRTLNTCKVRKDLIVSYVYEADAP